MLGYDMAWASFHVVEVMSSPKMHLKSVGYLAAAQSFNQDTDVLMLTTNLLKKVCPLLVPSRPPFSRVQDLSSSPADVAITLNGLSDIVTADLARDLSPELIAMLNHSRPHIRKRAVLTLYRVCEKYPDVLRQSMTRMQEKLDDSDPGPFMLITTYIHVLHFSQGLFLLLSMSYVNWLGETPKIIYHWHRNYFTCSPRHPITGCSSRSSNWSLIFTDSHPLR